jgi:hypothetical protein
MYHAVTSFWKEAISFSSPQMSAHSCCSIVSWFHGDWVEGVRAEILCWRAPSAHFRRTYVILALQGQCTDDLFPKVSFDSPIRYVRDGREHITVLLAASDYSRLVQQLFGQPEQAGVIHSVFGRAINIALGDTILSLLSADLPHMPNGVRLPAGVVAGPLQRLTPGVEVWIGAGKLLIPAYELALQLPATPPWEPRPAVAARRWQREALALHGRMLARYLADQPDHGGLSPLAEPLLLGTPALATPLATMALPPLGALARAARQCDGAGVVAATCELAGLGPGLTPAGDDALTGFAAVMALLGTQLSAGVIPGEHIATAIAATARPRTTALSATLLAHAGHGEVAEHLGDLLLALAQPAGETGAVRQAADRLLRFGATSGGDALLGVLLGLQAVGGGD